VHSVTWTSPSFHALFDRYIQDWRRDFFSLRYAFSIPLEAVRDAHHAAKATLLARLTSRCSVLHSTFASAVLFWRSAPRMMTRLREHRLRDIQRCF
jgi:hypothetical protein